MNTLADLDPGYWDALRRQPGYADWMGQSIVGHPHGFQICTAGFWIHHERGDTIRLQP